MEKLTAMIILITPFLFLIVVFIGYLVCEFVGCRIERILELLFGFGLEGGVRVIG